MRKKTMGLFVFLMAGIFFVCGSAYATAYNFGSMGLSEGQSFEGVTLGAATLASEAGDLHYTNSYGQGIFDGYGGTGDIYFTFSSPVNFVSFRGGDGGGDYDAFAISLYEFGTNSFLGTLQTPVFGGTNEPEWHTLAASFANIGKVVFDPGNSGVLPGVLGPSASGGLVITDFSYSAVPEPTTMLLLGLGLMGLAGVRRLRS